MQVKRRAATAVVGRLARGVGRVVKAVWAAPAGRGATGVKSTEGFLGWFPPTAHHASLASTRYNFRRAALVGRRRTDACMPGNVRCEGRD